MLAVERMPGMFQVKIMPDIKTQPCRSEISRIPTYAPLPKHGNPLRQVSKVHGAQRR